MNIFKEINDINIEDYFVAQYSVNSGTSLRDAAWNIAIGQSVGNPNVRNEWETDELFENHSCLIVGNEKELLDKKSGIVTIAFPIKNTDMQSDGISHLLCQLMGGHLDINIIERCRLINLQIPESVKKMFLGPKFGLTGFRALTNQYNKPLFGSIVKPKIGITPEILLEMVKQMVDGGVDFIKEDEIMSNPSCAPLERRVEIISNYLAKQSRKIVFCHTINCDPHIVVDRVNMVHNLGGNGVHINVYSGFGVYNSIRKMDLPLFLHLQSSGAKIFTDVNHRFSISWPVICQLATMMGVDTIQTGMVGGYSNDDPEEILECLNILRSGNTVPALSCGMHPGLVNKITSLVGDDYLANAGGSVHGHPAGTKSGALAMRQAIDKNKYAKEYLQAIEKWGLIE
jgi:ribulose 1,5-bisphosphate carboxylase large subunit-like protein